MDEVHQDKVKKYIQHGKSVEEAERGIYVVMLDCWPVNLSAETRRQISSGRWPGLAVLYVPAGATGDYQVHDTHLHKPFKDYIRTQAYAWYSAKVVKLSGLRKANTLSVPQYEAALLELMTIGKLRAKMVTWVSEALKKLQEPLDGGGECT
jgi:hypothetical protein